MCLSILRVDDDRDTAESSAALIRLFGYDVRAARSGAEALGLLTDGWHPTPLTLFTGCKRSLDATRVFGHSLVAGQKG
jgi:CheY-like chemotaxis protein